MKNPANFINIKGKRFGRWRVIDYRGKFMWECVCDCGNKRLVDGGHLRHGNTLSCGCFSKERAVTTNTTHGKSKLVVYGVWSGIKRRCYRSKEKNYHLYGGRGITLDKRWLNFDNFFKDIGYLWESGKYIDRIDVNKNYKPGNCRWVSPKESARNKRNSHKLTFNGKTLTIAEWAEQTGIKYNTIERRVNKYGWSDKKSILTPPLR